jgi:hypothetical protein
MEFLFIVFNDFVEKSLLIQISCLKLCPKENPKRILIAMKDG